MPKALPGKGGYLDFHHAELPGPEKMAFVWLLMGCRTGTEQGGVEQFIAGEP